MASSFVYGLLFSVTVVFDSAIRTVMIQQINSGIAKNSNSNKAYCIVSSLRNIMERKILPKYNKAIRKIVRYNAVTSLKLTSFLSLDG